MRGFPQDKIIQELRDENFRIRTLIAEMGAKVHAALELGKQGEWDQAWDKVKEAHLVRMGVSKTGSTLL